MLERIRTERLARASTAKQLEKIEAFFSTQEQGSEPLPQTWKYAYLNKVCESFQYGTSAKSLKSGEVPVLRMGNMQKGEIDWTDLVYSSDPEEIDKYSLQAGDVLFNRTNSPELVGKTSIYRGKQPAIFAGCLVRIVYLPEIDPEYLNYCLNSDYAKSYCSQVKSDGVSQSNINAQKLAKFELPLCSLQEQQEVVKRIKKLLKFETAIASQHNATVTEVSQLDQSILAKAFRGQLVPQDPTDEPASHLLARIRTERQTAAATKTAKKTKPNHPQ